MTSAPGALGAGDIGAGASRIDAGSPVWFGPPERPLFAMVHRPPGDMARAGVVLCPPLGREDLAAYSAYRTLAERLSTAGLAVVRFDYDGTGNSSGSPSDPDRVGAWTASIAAAVDLLRSTGVPALTLVGMRMGALLALQVTTDRPVDSLVLWDPCRSGRAFLRELQALHTMSIEEVPATDGSVQTPGFRFDAETVAALGVLDMARHAGPLAPRILLLNRPDRPVGRAIETRLSEAGALHVEPALGQNEILASDGLLTAAVEETIDRVTAWIGAGAPPEAVVLRPGVLDTGGETSVVGSQGASPVVERAVRFGEAGLFGIVTEALSGAGPSWPRTEVPVTTVVCFNTGKSRLIGPSRMWVDLARRWAAHGIQTLRVDLSGLGDSGTRPSQSRDVFYPAWARQDIEAAARFASPRDPSNVVFVGLCSGAFHAVLGGVLVGSRGVCAINPVFHRRSISAPDDEGTPNQGPRPDAPADARPRLAVRALASGVRRRVVAAAQVMPESVWSLSTRFGLRRSPVQYLEWLVGGGTHLLLITGSEEAALIRRGAARNLRSLLASGRLQFQVIADLDHALFGSQDRPRVDDILSGYVVDTFGPTGGR